MMKAEIQNDVASSNSEILNLNLNHYVPGLILLSLWLSREQRLDYSDTQ